ncbi:MAG: FKBP-type peptidyl-prolyl cis-trans isomerase, partial [Anaerolineales bacterium]|nr:FKBP-type peptidyl-prolyl cis-trans isomerase [Anaerolineales bacterium]
MKANYMKPILLLSLVLLFGLAACQPVEEAPEPTATSELEVVTGLEDPQGPAASEEDTPGLIIPEFPTPEPVNLADALVTETGLQYLEMVAGDGPAPQVGDVITMHYIASLPDGTELINTYTEGQPGTAIWGREQLLPGWEEGIGLMNEGGRATLVLPPELAFGAEGYGIIPPNSQVIIEVELLSVSAPPQPAELAEADFGTTDSGLMIAELVVGEGAAAKDEDTVTTHYIIWVQGEPENTFIVSSRDTEPLSFVLGRGDVVFPGWEEGVRGMQVGGSRQLIIPAELALGASGGGDIPPNATLIMEIELTELVAPPELAEVDEDDYTVTASGLKYYDLLVGDGATAEAGQTVVVHYTGWLEDGTIFDSSVQRGSPFTFNLGTGSVIVGWDEGVAGMQVGGQRQLVIPPELGYGEAGAGIIPPNATLIFQVELIEIL